MSDMWVPAGEDPRTQGNPQGEKATYVEYLQNYRLTLAMKCQGLTPEQLATRSVPPSVLSLLGLVRHMARVENDWFRRTMQASGEDRLYWSDELGDLAFSDAVGTRAGVDEAFAAWRREIAHAEEWLAGTAEEELGREVEIVGRDDEVVSIRDLLVHMIEEYARHCGHADLLRESIDGRTGQ